MSRPLKVGVQLPEAEWQARWSDLAQMARLAEDIGLDSIWLGDHLLYRDEVNGTRGPWEAWSTLSAIAAITSRVELGPLVAATAFHSPAMLAKKADAVDEISGGRLVLGLGAGWNETEFRAFGFPFDHRVSRFEEAFTIIRTLLREGAVDFSGRYYQARECELHPRGPRTGGPPIMVGSTGPRMLSITMPHVQSWNVWHESFGNDVTGFPGMLAKVDEACAKVGRDPASVERTVALLVGMPDGEGRRSGHVEARRSVPLDAQPERLAQSLRAYAALGVAHVQLVLDPITAASIERLAPMLEHLDAGS